MNNDEPAEKYIYLFTPPVGGEGRGLLLFSLSGYGFEFGPPAVRNILARVRPSLAQEVK